MWAVPWAVAEGGQRASEKDAVGGRARRPTGRALILTCWLAVLLLLLLLLVVCDKRGRVEGVGGQGLRLEVGGGALRWGRRRGLVAPRERGSAQARLLGRQQPAVHLVMLPAPLGLQAAVIPFLLSPLRAGTDKSKGQTGVGGTTAAHPPAPGRKVCAPVPAPALLPHPRDMEVDVAGAGRKRPAPEPRERMPTTLDL